MSARLKIAILSLLLVLPTASRLRASDDPSPTPAPEKKERKKKIVVQTPERVIVDDGEGLFIEGEGDDEDFFADLRGLDTELPALLRMHGFGGGYIGVQPIEMTEELREHFGAPKDSGVLIGKVYADEPAAKAGLEVGDILTAVDGARISSTRDLVRAVRKKKEGDTVSVSVLRDRAARTLTVSVAERKDGGMQLGELGPEPHRFYRREFRTPRPPRPPMPPEGLDSDSPELRQRLDDLEKRLHDLESRLPKKQSL